MRTYANWRVRWVALSFLLTLAVAALSCGGGGGNVQLDPTQNPGSNTSTSIDKGVGLVISEDEIGSLPVWQQEMLSDPGWNQPYIAPRECTPIEPPTHELLLAETQKALERGLELAPRVESGGKGVSWDDQGNYQPPTPVAKGEYETLIPSGDPQYGCNNYEGNSNNGHAIEDVIDQATMVVPQRISYVEQGKSSPNHFNKSGGAGNDAQSAVYQLFATDREADPLDPESTAEFAELSYRADLAPGVAPGGDCSAATAYAVQSWFWKRFNSTTNVLPGMTVTALYNILIAPSSEQTAEIVSSGATSAMYQAFYMGTLSACYGGGWIVGLTSSESDCDDFNQFVADGQSTGFYVRPVYGVLLKRWQDLQLSGMAGPWDSVLGWPVFGPVAHQNGSPVLTARGAYYAWGMWFEKGFIWWIDYDQDLYPNTPDEAQAYSYSGANVYCAENATYSKLGATIFYGGEGPLAVNVSIDAYRATAGDPWQPAPLDETGTFYRIGLPANDGLATVNVAMHAQGYGGVPNEDCVYKYYVWAFRNGQISAAGPAYSDSNKYVTTAYGNTVRNEEGVYVVRVQITDSEDSIAYGDSLPIHIGHGSPGGGGGEVMLIRNDGNAYPTGYDALKADLDLLGAAYAERPYSATVATDFHDDGFKVAIWYRGGPQATGETVPYSTEWTPAEIDNYLKLMNDGHQVLLVSQSHGYQNSTTPLPYGWQVYYGCTNRPASVPGGQERHPWAASLALELGIGLYGGDYFPSAPTNLTGLIQNGMFGPDSAAATGERYDGAGSSTKLPITFELSTSGTQYCGIGYWSPWMGGWASGPYFRGGMAAAPAFLGYNLGYLSWGNLQAPDSNIGFFPNYTHTSGPGKLWIIGYPYSKLKVLSAAGGATMTRDEVLKNMLGWLNSGLVWGAGPSVAYDEYAGPPEILQVMPGWWEAGEFHTGAAAQTWNGASGNYPDPTGSDVYRTTDPGSGNYVVTTTPNNDWINGNDVDFQFPWYAYIVDVAGDGVDLTANDDDTMTLGGLLLEDPDGTWTRDMTLGPYDNPDSLPTPSVCDPGGPAIVVAGYYVATTTGDTGDEVRANYGDGVPTLTWDNADELVIEAIAHWPAGFSPDQVFWSMYPGQDMFDPVNYPDLIGSDATWEAYRASFDIDPTISNARRDTPANPGQVQWNRAQFMFSDAASSGRTLAFDYNSIPNWNGDLNRDGVVDVKDKFPVRCRLFTDLTDMTMWPWTWPNHMYNAGSDPGPDWPVDANPPQLEGGVTDGGDFVEGGCYLVDTGLPNYPVTISDNRSMPDPGNPDAYTSTGPNFYSVNLYFSLYGGTMPYTKIEFDYNFDPVGGWNPTSPSVGEVTVDPLPMDHWGAYHGTIDCVTTADPWLGYMALRVTDANGDTDVYWYSSKQNWHQIVRAAVLIDPLSQALTDPGKTYKRDVQKIVDDLKFLYEDADGTVTVIDLATTLTAGQLNGYNLIVWPVDRANYYESSSPYGITNGTANGNVIEVARAHTSNGASVLLIGNSFWQKIINSSSIPQWDQINPCTGNYHSYYTSQSTGGTQLLPNTNTIPNNLTGISLKRRVADRICQYTHGPFWYYTWGLRSLDDPTNYPVANCANFMSGLSDGSTSYIAGAYARKATGKKGNLILVVMDYGDLEEYQSATARFWPRPAALENILCCAQVGSTFDSPVTTWPNMPEGPKWAHTIGMYSSSEYQYGVTSDASGNVYTVGYTYNAVSSVSPYSYYDTVITKYNSAGSVVAVKLLDIGPTASPTYRYNYGYDCVIDTASSPNYLYVYGHTNGVYTSQSYYRPFVAKIRCDTMALVSAPYYVSMPNSYYYYASNYCSMGLDNSGNPLLLYYTTSVGTSPNYAVYVTKLNTSLAHQWTREFRGASSTANIYYYYPHFVTSDTSGNVYVTGQYYDSSGTGYRYYDIALLKFDSAGNYQWAYSLGVPYTSPSSSTWIGYDMQMGLTRDTSGNLYIGSYGYNTCGTGTSDNDWYITKLSASGSSPSIAWTRYIGSPGSEYGGAYSTSYCGNGLSMTTTGNLGLVAISSAGLIGTSYDVGWAMLSSSTGLTLNSGVMGTTSTDYIFDNDFGAAAMPSSVGYSYNVTTAPYAPWYHLRQGYSNDQLAAGNFGAVAISPIITTMSNATSTAVSSYVYRDPTAYVLDTGAGGYDMLTVHATSLAP